MQRFYSDDKNDRKRFTGPRSGREGNWLGTEDIVKESSVLFTFSSLDREDHNNSNVMFSEVNFQSEILFSI